MGVLVSLGTVVGMAVAIVVVKKVMASHYAREL